MTANVLMLMGAGHAGSSGGNPTFASALSTAGITNIVATFDAGDSSSYTGSGQNFSDVSGAANHLYLGATSGSAADDPTFNGSAGGLSSSEYFSVDGGDIFKLQAGSNPAAIDNMHKDGFQGGIIAFFYFGSVASFNGICGTSGGTTGHGFYVDNSGKMNIQIQNGGANALSKVGDSSVSATAWHMLGVSIDENAGAAGGFLYLDGAYNQVSASNTWNPSYSSPSAGAATSTLELCTRGSASLTMVSGGRVACLAIMSGATPTKAQFDSVWSSMRTRFGL